MQININYDALTKQGQLITEYSEELENQVRNLLLKIEELSNHWYGGKDYVFYNSSMKDKIILELQKIYPIIESYGEYAEKVAEAYKLLDDSFKNKKINVR